MPTAWETTPNDPAVRLPSRYKPLVFTPSAEPIAISVAFPLGESRRPEERAFRDGVFLWPYLGSKREGNTFTLVREGGWPSDPKPFVDPTPPIVATFWDLLYDVDFTTQGSSTILARVAGWGATDVAIAGQTWRVTTQSLSGLYPTGAFLVSGVGLQLECHNSSWTLNHYKPGGAPYGTSAISVALSTISGWSASRRTAVIAHVIDPLAPAPQGAVGCILFRADSSQLRGGGFFAPDASRRTALIPQVTMTHQPVSTAVDHVVASIAGASVDRFACAAATGTAPAPDMPAIEKLRVVGQCSEFDSGGGGVGTAYTRAGVTVGAGASERRTVTVKRLQILQQDAA